MHTSIREGLAERLKNENDFGCKHKAPLWLIKFNTHDLIDLGIKLS